MMRQSDAFTVTAEPVRYALRAPFRIARGVKTHAEAVSVRLSAAGVEGRAEATPYARYGETIEKTLAMIEQTATEPDLEDAIAALPASAARNALDCALWDWRAKQSGQSIWALTQTGKQHITTAFTLSLDTPEAMAHAAKIAADLPILKIKLGTDQDIPRLEAVRSAAPNAALLVDANEGWNARTYQTILPDLKRLGVSAIEQPLPADDDAALADLPRPVPVIADESCHTTADLLRLKDRYDMVNIKLDKTGGLTEALQLVRAARQDGFGIMTGCMVGSSLAMAPAIVIAAQSDIVDLDGPLWLKSDSTPSLHIKNAVIHPPSTQLWG